MKLQATTIIPVPMPYENRRTSEREGKTLTGSLIFLHIILLIMFVIRFVKYFYRKRIRSFADYISGGAVGVLPYFAIILFIIDTFFIIGAVGYYIGRYL